MDTETEIARLYRDWRKERGKLMTIEGELFASIDDESGKAIDAAHDAQCTVVWDLEGRIAGLLPETINDVRLKALVVAHWMKDAHTEKIMDDFLASLVAIPEAKAA